MIKSLLLKELRLLGKAKNGILSLLSLMFAFLFIFHYSLEKSMKLDVVSLIGLKWATIFLLSFVLIGQITYEERESGAYRVSALFVPPYLEYITKSIVVFIGLVIIEIIMNALLFVFFESMRSENVPLYQHVLFLLPGSLSISFLGVTLSEMSFGTRLKEILLPVLLIPLSIPVLLVGMEAERKLFIYNMVSIPYLVVLLSFSVLYLAIGILLREIAPED